MSNYVYTLGFNNKRVADRSFKIFEQTRTSDAKICVLNQHYPGVEAEYWKNWAESLGGVFLDAGENLGLHEGLNYISRQINVQPTDKVIGFDIDCNPVTCGWDTQLLNALDISDVGWASLWNNHSGSEMTARGFNPSMENGLFLWTTHAPVVNSICAFTMDWVLPVGFKEPSKYYGGFEVCMWPRLRSSAKRWVFLVDYIEEAFAEDLVDQSYKVYKWEHAHKGYPHDYDTFLAENKDKWPI
jgi:hypothetical protein